MQWSNMKISIVLCGFTFIIFQAYCIQKLYKFVPEHCEITEVNNSLVKDFQYSCSKRNRTTLLLNATFTPKVDIFSNQMGQVLITGYMFRSNEYRKGPIEFMMGLCSGFTTQDFDVPHVLSNSNLKCPIQKGHRYYVYNVNPDATNMPPLIPEGRWRLDVKVLYMNKYVIFNVNWYSGVEYPFQFK